MSGGAPALPEEAYAAALASITYLRPTELASRLAGRKPSAVWSSLAGRAGSKDTARQRIARGTDVAAVWAHHGAAGVRVTLPDGEGYPAALAADLAPPAVLFSLGDLGLLAEARRTPRVGIVGTRRCTPYGREVARSFGAALTAAGVTVVSGLAKGIDGAAHRGALAALAAEGGAPPIGVVGSGLDVPYPAVHAELWSSVASAGLLLSEAACGGIPAAWRFPFRNRIIAALSDVVLVVESHAAGGAMHTVEAAVERGRTVLAVPGSIRSSASAGTNRLLFDGHGPARDPEDVLVALGLAGHPAGAARPTQAHDDAGDPPDLAGDGPESDDARVEHALEWSPTSVDALLGRTGLPLGRVALALYRLQDEGRADESEGWWQRCRS